LVDPTIQMRGYAQLAFQMSLADVQEAARIFDYEHRIGAAIREGDFLKGFEVFDEFINGDFFPYPTYFFNITGVANYFNLNDPTYPPNPYPTYLNLASTRSAIHVGAIPYWDYNQTVEANLKADWLATVKDKVEFMLDHKYKVMVYNGQDDIILSGPQAYELCLAYNWDGKERFNRAPKII